MGTSFVDFRGAGFWANDGLLDIWLELLVREIDARAPVPDWLAELRDRWQAQARFGGVGCIDTALDEFITGDARKEVILAVAVGALARLARYGGTIGREELNRLNGEPAGVDWTSDLPTGAFAALGDAFISLLRGEIATTAATAPIIR